MAGGAMANELTGPEQAKDSPAGMQARAAGRILSVAEIYARIALGAAFLSAVADRFGLWGAFGKPHVAWGDFAHFTHYAGMVNSFLPARVIPAVAWTATIAETVFGMGLIFGIYMRVMTLGSAALLLLFALAMTISFGVKAPLDYSVFGASAAAFLLFAIQSGRKCESSAMDSRLEKLKRNLESAVGGMSSEQLSWHLPGKWCAAEVLEHLYLTYAATIGALEKVITNGKPLATRASIAQRVLTFLVVGLGHMPAGRKAPAIVEPRGLPVEQVRNEIGAKLVAMDTTIVQCEARFGRQVKLREHPILGPLTATQWRKLHLVHGRHHLKQLLRLRESTTRQERTG
jgi:putative oxidoreductase